MAPENQRKKNQNASKLQIDGRCILMPLNRKHFPESILYFFFIKSLDEKEYSMQVGTVVLKWVPVTH